MAFRAAQLVEIVSHGGGVSIDSSKFLIDQLKEIASHAAASGATVVFRNASAFRASQLIEIAAQGKGNVIFEV